jgi:hypothetical protein
MPHFLIVRNCVASRTLSEARYLSTPPGETG